MIPRPGEVRRTPAGRPMRDARWDGACLAVSASHAFEKAHDFRLAIATMPTERPDRAQLACLRPTSNRLGVHTEKRSDFRGGEKRLTRVLVPLQIWFLLSHAAAVLLCRSLSDWP